MLQKLGRILGGDPNKREMDRMIGVVKEINALEERYEKFSDEELSSLSGNFRARLAEGETLDDLLPEAFAAVREASKRTIGLRHFDVQMIGGMTLHKGMIAEMRTGEGKTLVATLPVYLNALTGRGVHLVTVNDYLARRDARWMAPIYHLLGLSVGVLQMAARTDNGQKAFIVDLEKESPFEDQNQLVLVDRAEAYKADITYGTNSEFGFDYLRDNLTESLEARVQRGHYYAIIDEVDNVLIDEARTPLIISGPASEDTAMYESMAQVVRQLNPEDFEVNEKDRTVTLTEVGEAHVEELLGTPLRDPDRPEDITPEQANILGHLEQALKAQALYRRNKDYIVQGGKVIIVDEFTGRLMPGRRWSEGLHQAVEAKESVKVEPENVTYATITIQNYFRMYEKLAGMTGTALTESEEFGKIYKLDVLPIPTNLEYNALGSEARFQEVKDKDLEGYQYVYYARLDDPDRRPNFYKRKDYPDVVYRSEEAKLRAITLEIIRYHVIGRPQLVGTTSVEHSERLSERLGAEPVRRLLQTLLVRDAWFRKNNRKPGETAIPELQFLNKPVEQLNTAELRQFARANDLATINLEDQDNLPVLLDELGLQQQDSPRLVKVLQGGIPHQVLNARKHDEESQIIAHAGAFGAVTIATNMAGRGVDIKLGGELSDEVYADVTRVLRNAGIDPYGMKLEEMLAALERVPEEEFGIYEESVRAFRQHLEDMQRVRDLGGLHVVGSERHEARRIDNQLRGRAARQGDPGSSRFYLSLEDELMRLFGGGQVEGLMRRLNIDESLPIESNMVGKLVEQSQTRVEGANFDVRKHLLEYDDVLNSQRQRIYTQRDRVFTKDDLTEDVEEMLAAELDTRVPAALADAEGPWKLLGYLDEIQPPVLVDDHYYPTYTLRLLAADFMERLPEEDITTDDLAAALDAVARKSLGDEHEHVLRAARELLEKMEDAYQRQLDERIEAMETFFEGRRLGEEEEEGLPAQRPQEAANELANLVRTSLRLTPDQMRRTAEGDAEMQAVIRQQIENSLTTLTLNRLIGTLARRLDEIDLKASDLEDMGWPEISDAVYDAVDQVFDRRQESLLGEQGQLRRELQTHMERIAEADTVSEIEITRLLLGAAQGARTAFDARTHQRVLQRYMRLNYIFPAARLLEDREPELVQEDVLVHLRGAQAALQTAFGQAEWNRLRLANVALQQLDDRTRLWISERLGAERFEELAEMPLAELSGADQQLITDVLGRRVQNEVYRQLLLRVISNLWVEYLTRMEALRVSIGLEAFAQRDPLVQYKSQATELFRQLLGDIRSGVVTRMFMIVPARQAQPAAERREAAPIQVAQPSSPAVAQAENPAKSGKKKRRRHR